jgi:hypothetical protein
MTFEGQLKQENPLAGPHLRVRDKNNNTRSTVHLTLMAIAASAVFGYNPQPNQSIPSLFLVQVLSSGWEYKKMGRCPFFFC